MNDKDKKIIDILMQDKEKKYKVFVDNDNVCVVDTVQNVIVHDFEHFGYEMVLELFKYLGINAEMC